MDEFAFGPPEPTAGPVPVFKSRRREQILKTGVRAVSKANYLPQYQMFGQITGFSTSIEKPSIGFSVKATGSVSLHPHQKVVRAI